MCVCGGGGGGGGGIDLGYIAGVVRYFELPLLLGYKGNSTTLLFLQPHTSASDQLIRHILPIREASHRKSQFIDITCS